jgi:phosphomannomutase
MHNLGAVFRAYDVRGIVGKELSNELAYYIGQAFGDFLPQKSVVGLGQDMRHDSAAIAQHLAAGLMAAGQKVTYYGQISTDMLYYAVGKYQLAGGAMVTASHNPARYNGIKFCGQRAVPIGHDSGLEEVRARVAQLVEFKNQIPPQAAGLNEYSNNHETLTADWVTHVLGYINRRRLRPLKLAVDAANGMTGPLLPMVFSELPITVIPLFFEPDGAFPNHPPNPAVTANLSQLREAVVEQKLDGGIAFDGDGDRVFMVDEKGQPLSASTLMCLLIKDMLTKSPGAVITHDVRMSRAVGDTIRKYGGVPLRTRVGGPYIKHTMRARKAVLGGEGAGHFYFQNNYYSDSGLIAALVALDIIGSSNQSISELAAEFSSYASSGEINLEVADKVEVIEHLALKYEDGEQDRLDGLSVEYADWWFNVRPSNTEPYLRLNVEANSQSLLEDKLAELKAAIA